ncbi:MAG TPA: uroporphyrinogen decarboxylase family protein [Anaerolineae bacterium]|nr:uroporphyrinogen decarboxylase family protein [Anaerolineae bacterium]
MNSSERVSWALNHREPDRIPFDLGGTGLTTLHVDAYRNLRQYLGLPCVEAGIMAMAEQLAKVDEDMAALLQTDCRLVSPNLPSDFEYVFRDEGAYEAYTDEWGIGWRKPKEGGLYYDMCYHPLADASSLDEFKAHPFPNPVDERRLAGLREQAEAAAKRGKAVVLSGPCAGVAEVYSWMRGYEAYYLDLALNREIVAYMLDRLLEFKCAYWEKALQIVGDLVDVVVEADDLAGQQSLLLSPRTYRSLIKPRHQRLFAFIKDQAPVKVFFHSCGAIRPLLGDLIDAGIDILNPVQISAAGMDLRELKAEFGCDLVFWGGGVDTQGVLGSGTPEQIREDVRRNIEALAPGGGFVFAAVHDIQANVPPRNVIAMWEVWNEYGTYPASI